MTKKILIVRHAKSSWLDPQVEDFSRKLNERGKKDLKFMPEEISKIFPSADLILVSPAKRTVKTAEKILKKIDWSDHVELMYQLYEADKDVLLKTIKQVENKFSKIVIIGHNPGLTDLVNFLQSKKIENIPTLGCAVLSFKVKSWTSIGEKSGRLEKFIYPKLFKKVQGNTDVSKN